MSDEFLLTTIDNPYNPFKDYEAWLSWDMKAGYDTSGFLARMAAYSSALSDAEQEENIQATMREIVANNVTGMYALIRENDKTPLSTKRRPRP